MKYLFGPVNSRRLGLSLGIDLLPHKTCSMDCVYCECGKTTCLTTEIREYVPSQEVISELNKYLADDPELDVITFAGSGEPTLHSGIGEIIDYLKDNHPEYTICVLTNGTLLHHENIRKSILRADIIIPSLDAVSKDVFDRITNPAQGINTAFIINGIIELRNIYKGKIILEVFIVPGLNDTMEELGYIKEACMKINPDRIQINTLDRPGTENWIRSSTSEEINTIIEFLKPLEADIISKSFKSGEKGKNPRDITDTIISILERRPSTVDDLSSALGINNTKIIIILQKLINQRLIEESSSKRGTFYCIKRKYQV